MTSIFQDEKARWNKEKLERLTREGCVFSEYGRLRLGLVLSLACAPSLKFSSC